MLLSPGPHSTLASKFDSADFKASAGSLVTRTFNSLRSVAPEKPGRLVLGGRSAFPLLLLAGGLVVAYKTQEYVQKGKEGGDRQVRANMAGYALAGGPAAAIPHPLDANKIRAQAALKGAPPLPTTVRNAAQGIVMASGAQVVRLGLTSSFKAGMGKYIASTDTISEEWKPVVSKVSIFAGAGAAELVVHAPTAIKNLQILDPDGKGIIQTAQSRSIASLFSRGTGAALTRKAGSQGILFAFKEDLDAAISETFPSLSKTEVTATSSFILGSLGETATNWIDRVRIIRQNDLTISKIDAIKEALREPFKGALKASMKKGISRSIYMTGLELIVQHWDKVEDAVETFLNKPGVMEKAEALMNYFFEQMSPIDTGPRVENTPPPPPSSPNPKVSAYSYHEDDKTEDTSETSPLSDNDKKEMRAHYIKMNSTSKQDGIRTAETTTTEEGKGS